MHFLHQASGIRVVCALQMHSCFINHDGSMHPQAVQGQNREMKCIRTEQWRREGQGKGGRGLNTLLPFASVLSLAVDNRPSVWLGLVIKAILNMMEAMRRSKHLRLRLCTRQVRIFSNVRVTIEMDGGIIKPSVSIDTLCLEKLVATEDWIYFGFEVLVWLLGTSLMATPTE